MKRKLLILGTFACLAAIVISGCMTPKGSSLSEGVIEYDATVLNTDNPMASFAPSKMTFRFKTTKCRAELSAAMGIFKTAFISNSEKKILVQLVKVLNDKLAHTYDLAAMKKENEALPQFTIVKSEEVKVIAGYNCKKATAKFADKQFPDFDVYYTNEIDIASPNWGTPFNDIEGVLMEYQVSRYGMDLRFTAKSVTGGEVESTLFEIPKDYKVVSAEFLDNYLKNFQ